MNTAQVGNTECDILRDVFDQLNEDAWSKIALTSSGLNVPQKHLAKVEELLAKNQVGSISQTELRELENYSRVGNFLIWLKATAHRHVHEPALG
jgi:hypothetical protein